MLIQLASDIAEACFRPETAVDQVVIVNPPAELPPLVRMLKRRGKEVVLAARQTPLLPIGVLTEAGRALALVAHQASESTEYIDKVITFRVLTPEPPLGWAFIHLCNKLRDELSDLTDEQIRGLISGMIRSGVLYQTEHMPGKLRTVGLSYEHPTVRRRLIAMKQTPAQAR